jgi:GNAT superfamily N-acetyltransferase
VRQCDAHGVRVSVGSQYVVTDDPDAIDRDRLFGWLESSYWWSGGLHRSVFDVALDHSLCLSVRTTGGDFVGFGRMVTDRATFAYWADVYVDAAHRGRGLGRALTGAALDHRALASCRRILLATRDAHEVYARHGFVPLADPALFMEISRPHAGADRAVAP